MTRHYDRSAEDLGNIVGLEHVNVQIEDQRLATLFYMSGLGLTRDPYLMTGIDNMWVNVGRSQFHLPTGTGQRLRGRVGLVVPDRAALLRRLENVAKLLDGTRFEVIEHDHHVEAVCPWGNRMVCHEPGPQFGPFTLAMPYVEFDVPPGAANGIAAFYRKVFGAAATVDEKGKMPAARVPVGMAQDLVFRETEDALPEYDGHHIQIYVADFSGPHRRLLDRDLVSEESNQHQYRFENIVDPESRKPLFRIEHEVRSMRHPLYARPLVNRDPAQNNRNYAPGYDAWIPGTIPEEMDDPRVAMRQQRFEAATQRAAAGR